MQEFFAAYDPYLLCAGMILVGVGLAWGGVLETRGRSALRLHWLAKGVGYWAIIESLVVGFWIFGWWWLLIAPILLWNIPVITLAFATVRSSRVGGVISLAVGLSFVAWSASPTLFDLGVMPSLIT